jgi:hypothetical protein
MILSVDMVIEHSALILLLAELHDSLYVATVIVKVALLPEVKLLVLKQFFAIRRQPDQFC